MAWLPQLLDLPRELRQRSRHTKARKTMRGVVEEANQGCFLTVLPCRKMDPGRRDRQTFRKQVELASKVTKVCSGHSPPSPRERNRPITGQNPLCHNSLPGKMSALPQCINNC
jgi:hypothetical protein